VFICEFDSAFGFGIMLFEPPFEEADFEQYVELVPKLDKRIGEREGSALVLEFAPGYPGPNALWRKRFVEARRSMVSKPVVAIVVPSFAMRAGVALAAWIKPRPFEQGVFGTFAEAMVWLEEKRGPTTKILQSLYADAKKRV
jgi:hypothetical protein